MLGGDTGEFFRVGQGVFGDLARSVMEFVTESCEEF